MYLNDGQYVGRLIKFPFAVLNKYVAWEESAQIKRGEFLDFFLESPSFFCAINTIDLIKNMMNVSDSVDSITCQIGWKNLWVKWEVDIF